MGCSLSAGGISWHRLLPIDFLLTQSINFTPEM